MLLLSFLLLDLNRSQCSACFGPHVGLVSESLVQMILSANENVYRSVNVVSS